MRRLRQSLMFTAALVFGLAMLWRFNRPATLSAVRSESLPSAPKEAAAVSSAKHRLATDSKAPTKTVSLSQDPEQEPSQEVAEQLPREVQDELAAILGAVDPMNIQDLDRAVDALRRQASQQVSAFFLQRLHELGSEEAFERDRLILVANRLQAKTDLPFWQDLALRKTARYAHEKELRNPEHPTLESRYVDLEQLQAIRNIGLLARDDRSARKVLADIVLHPDPSAHRALHREEAYRALKEADLPSSLRVLKQLAADDELFKRL